MAFLLEEERPSSTSAAYVENSTLHVFCGKLLSRIPVLVLSKIVLRQRLTRIYETVVSLHHLDHFSAFEEIVQLVTVCVLGFRQQILVLPLTTRSFRVLNIKCCPSSTANAGSSNLIRGLGLSVGRVMPWSDLDAEAVVSKLELMALMLLLKFQIVLIGASP